jgi:DNA-binding MarR family transcriptional regulator
MLFALFHKDGQSQRELSQKLRIKPATITVMLNRMEKSGLLERRPDPEDQRISRVYITDKGRKKLHEIEESMKTMEEECFTNFTTEEKIVLRRLFMQMRENLIRANEGKLNYEE